MPNEINKYPSTNNYDKAQEALLGRYLTGAELPQGAEDITGLVGTVRLTGEDDERLQALTAAIKERDEHIGPNRWVFYEKYPYGHDPETGKPIGDIITTNVPILELSTALLADAVESD